MCSFKDNSLRLHAHACILSKCPSERVTIHFFRFGISLFGGFRGRGSLHITLTLVGIVFKQMVFVDIINDLNLFQ